MIKISVIWSICIPTYNRAECLKINLNYIFKQITEENREKIEILVSNNASSDNTDQIVKNFINSGYDISYYYNIENIGPERNFLQCVTKAKGRYVLLLGDDDILLKGAIDNILNILNNDDYGAVYISNNGLRFLENFQGKNALDKNDIKEIIVKDSNEFIKKVSYNITFISGIVFNKTYLKNIERYERYIGSYFIHTTFFLSAIFESKKNVFIKASLIASMENNNGGYKLVEVFCVNFNKILLAFLPIGLEKATIQCINNNLITTFFPFFIYKIRRGKTRFISEDMEFIFYNNYSNNWRYWLFLYPLLELPSAIIQYYLLWIRAYNKLYRKLRNTSVI